MLILELQWQYTQNQKKRRNTGAAYKEGFLVLKTTISHYSANAEHYYSLYQSISADSVHGYLEQALANTPPSTALDVGAGSGRDANWLAAKGWQVTATEPAEALLKLAKQHSKEKVTWCNAALPALANLPTAHQYKHKHQHFDLILLSAVWMHLPINDRPRAIKRLAELLSAHGRMYISLRFGPSDPERPMYPVSYEELQALAAENGLTARNLNPVPSKDGLKRSDVEWVTVELVSAGSK
ncbi:MULTISPECIES: class I SAM-dependent methyltransferase [unclassified Alteromonas]|uniref:class I SAM-dependent methyltransferase n=1 Tax=unclassified Alteromonas TaxID=2614992 RepID=UPI0009DDEC6E|nr:MULTISPECIES: class I SAM-dependent methyltransferase [unclassified Alteromonas]